MNRNHLQNCSTRKIVLPLLSLILFSGCFSAPKCDPAAQIPATAPLSTAVKEALTSSDFTQGDWPAEAWWEMFEDPQLGQFIQTAIEESPTLNQAMATAERTRQMALIERSRLFPGLDGVAEVNWQHLSKTGLFRTFATTFPANIYQIDIQLNFTYEFDIWGKNRKRYDAALSRFQAEAAEAAQVKLSLSTAIAQNYMHLQIRIEKLRLMEAILEKRSALLNLNKSRFQHGVDTEINPLTSQQELLEIEKMIVEQRQLVALSKHLLNNLMGRAPDAEIKTEGYFNWNARAFPLPSNLQSDLLARRPDLMAQIWMVESAAFEIGAAKTDFYPNLDLTAFGGVESLQLRNLFSIHNFNGSFFPAIHLPIFTGGRLEAALAEKVAAYEEAVYDYQELVLRAAKEVADQLLLFRSYKEQLSLQQQNVESKSVVSTLVSMRYQRGVDNYLEALRAEEEVLTERLNELDLQYAFFTALIDLIKGLGGGYANG